MPLPAVRSKILPLRGLKASLDAVVVDILEGEFCYATDQEQYYQKENGVLVAVGATKAQGALADSALQDAPSDGSQYVRKDGAWAVVNVPQGGLQPGDNVSELNNDAGYITLAEVPPGGGIPEAPTDGSAYVRKDSQWVDSFDLGVEVVASKTLSYDADGKLTGITGASVSKTLTYDANGRLQTLVATKGSTTITKTFTYDADGTLNQITVS